MILSEYLPTVAVAQLVEHWIVIPRVAGSSPVGRPFFMNNFEACILGILQGILEYLPISSSFHLALVKKNFAIQSSSLFDVSCHAGTLLSAIIFFRKDFQRLLQNKKIFLWLILALLPLGFGYIFWRKSRAFFPSYLGIFFSSFCLFWYFLGFVFVFLLFFSPIFFIFYGSLHCSYFRDDSRRFRIFPR